jgi:predicted nucleic acid-binding protein
MVIFSDTSFLFSLYGNDAHSPRALAWIVQCTSAIVLSPLTQYEFGNALRFAEFRGLLKPGAATQYWALFEGAVTQGRLIVENCNLADVVDEAKRLSAMHTVSGGHRGFDILHVAAALELGAREFLTFDENQKRLAESEGLRVPLFPAKRAAAAKHKP